MIALFNEYIARHKLFEASDKLLVGLSGGRDSVVLTHLMHQAGYEFAIAHCHFHLRGAESDEDAVFSRQLAETLNHTFHQQDFDTMQYAADHKISIQMAARQLRLDWFDDLCNQFGYTKIVLAHHADDQAETFFINLIRGSSLAGLKGMKPIHGKLTRPLLFATREQINAFVVTHRLAFREDSTNSETDYLRNKIRHTLMKPYSELHAAARLGLQRSMELLADDHQLFETLIAREKQRLLYTEDSSFVINRAELITQSGRLSLIYSLLRDFGFSSAQASQIDENLDRQAGSRFFSPDYVLDMNRDRLEIRVLTEDILKLQSTIAENTYTLEHPVRLRLDHKQLSDISSIRQPAHIALLDKEKLTFPLEVRLWQQGDRFVPFGMKGTKLISDYLIDSYSTRAEKEKAFVLIDATGTIIWLIGYRTDDRFRIDQETKHILQITYIK